MRRSIPLLAFPLAALLAIGCDSGSSSTAGEKTKDTEPPPVATTTKTKGKPGRAPKRTTPGPSKPAVGTGPRSDS